MGAGHYVGVLASANAALRDRVDDILREAMRDGRLEAIFRRWGLWNPAQAQLRTRARGRWRPWRVAAAGQPSAPSDGRGPAPSSAGVSGASETSTAAAAVRYLPSLFRAAAITLAVSCAAMALAVMLGIGIASGRVYGRPAVRLALTAWVELIRGTPLLLQLFVLYFGLAPVVQLPALVAALIGLGLNYGAYESEIYRGALLAVPSGQLDAARALGLTDRQTLRLVRGPQALRLSLAPMTNDFVALLKDSSLVPVITVVELTKQTSIFAANIGSWLRARRAVRGAVPGDVAAARRRWPCASNAGGARDDGALTVQGLDVRRGGRLVVRDVSFGVTRGRDRGADGRVGQRQVQRAARHGGARAGRCGHHRAVRVHPGPGAGAPRHAAT